MQEPKAGLVGEAEVTVSTEKTAEAVGSGSLPVLATPVLVALAEQAAVNALASSLPAGRTTVGGRIEVFHTAATPLGMQVKARAKLLETDGRKLVFKVTAFDASGQIGHGTHDRFMVDEARFMKKVQERG